MKDRILITEQSKMTELGILSETAGGKINDNFEEIYQYLGQIDSSTLSSKITISDSATNFEAGYIRFEGLKNVDA